MELGDPVAFGFLQGRKVGWEGNKDVGNKVGNKGWEDGRGPVTPT